jgi:hypothetical protein
MEEHIRKWNRNDERGVFPKHPVKETGNEQHCFSETLRKVEADRS